MKFQAYIQIFITWLLTSGLQIVITLVLAFFALKAGKIISRRFVLAVIQQKGDPEFIKRTQTLGSIVRYLLSATILVVTAIIVLGEFGVEIGPILAAAGVVGLAVGFGAQNLVRDVISGVFIIMEGQEAVGGLVGIQRRTGR